MTLLFLMESLELNRDLYYKIVDYARAKGYSENTIKTYSHYLKRLIKKYPLLNRDVLNKILRSMKHQNQRAILTLINDYCFYSDIDFKIMIPKIKSNPKKLPTITSIEEIKMMISSTPKPYDLMIRCIFNMGGGLRISEAIKLSWNHINWVDWLKNKGYGVCIIKDAKGGKDRTTNIPQNLMQSLYDYAKELKILNEFGIPRGSMIFECGLGNFKPDLLINNKKKWRHEAIKHAYDWFRYNILQKHCEKAVGHKLKIHSLRHSRATYLYEVEKVPIEKIQLLLGHSDITNTLIYTKVSIKDTFEMIKDAKEI